MWMTTFWMGYLLTERPFIEPDHNTQELVNELFYFFLLLSNFTFTELIPDMATKTQTGYFFIATLLLMLAINISIQLKDTIA